VFLAKNKLKELHSVALIKAMRIAFNCHIKNMKIMSKNGP